MNAIESASHWSEDGRRALREAKAKTADGCGSCIHAGWGALPDVDSGDGKACDLDFVLIACAKGVVILGRDGRLQPQQFCTLWNSAPSSSEPPPIPDSSAGTCRINPMAMRAVHPTGR